MATYAIGDVQGCYDELMALLDLINFDASVDILWFAGDLVNRGPKSLKTLRFIRSLGANAKVVLGNHDLHALAVYHDPNRLKTKDTIEKLLIADDAASLFTWLAQQSLALYSPKLNYLMVHAGIPLHWDLRQTLKCAKEVETQLRNPKKCAALMKSMYGDTPDTWSKNLRGNARYRYIINAFTRMRYCYTDGRLELTSKMGPAMQQSDVQPWFQLSNPLYEEVDIIFGHWAALLGETTLPTVHAIDTGCVWGAQLTALELESGELYRVESNFQAKE